MPHKIKIIIYIKKNKTTSQVHGSKENNNKKIILATLIALTHSFTTDTLATISFSNIVVNTST